MKKEVKISYATMDKITDMNKTQPAVMPMPIAGGEDCLIQIKQHISLEDKINFGECVRQIVFCPDENGYVGYRAAYEGAAFRFALLKYCTNLKMEDFNRTYGFYSNDTIYYSIYAYIPNELISELRNIANHTVDYCKQELLQGKDEYIKELTVETSVLNEQIKGIIDGFEGFDVSQVMNMVGNINSMSDEERVNKVLEFQRKEEVDNE